MLSSAAATTTLATTVTFNTRAAFNAATTGTTTVNFNGVAPSGGFVGALPTFTSNGVIFTPGAGNNLFVTDTGFDTFYQFAGASGGVLSVQAGTTRTLNIALGGSFTAIGFDVNNVNFTGPLTITATLSNGDVTSFTTTPAGNFFGFTTTPAIVSLSLTAPNTGGSFGFSIDNFTFGQAQGGGTAVPEPATMILLGTGLAGVVAKVRKRRKAE